MVRGGSSSLGPTGKASEVMLAGRLREGPREKRLARVARLWQESASRLVARARRPTWLDANTPACTPYPAAAGRTLYRAFYTDSSGVPRQKRGFTSPSAAAKFRA